MRHLLLFSFAPLLMGADVQLDAPVLGFVVRSQPLELRAVLGVPGAARMSDPLALPEGVTALHLAPGQGWAVALRAGARALAWPIDREGAVELSAVVAAPDLIAFSPSGKEAAFFWRDGGRLVIYGGLPENPRLLREAAELNWAADLQSLALADGGEWMAACASAGQLLLIAASDLAPVPLYSTETLAGAAFLARSTDLVVADSAAARVLLFERPTEQSAARVLLSAADGLESPDLLWGGAAGRLMVGSCRQGRIWTIDLVAGSARSLESPVEALQPLRLQGLMMVSSNPDQPAWLVHAAGPAERLSFVASPPRPGNGVEE
jgi:hypothetical protein